MDGGSGRRPSAGSFFLFFFSFSCPSLPAGGGPAMPPGARCVRYLGLGGGSFLTCARLCQWQRTWRPRRPISARLVPLPAPLVKESSTARESYLCAPGPAALPCRAPPALQPRRSPHARGRGLYLSCLGGWLWSRERGGRKAELPVALVLPSRAFTRTPSPAQT